MTNYRLGSFFQKVKVAISGSGQLPHTHTASQITDFNEAVDDRIQNIIGAAPSALDTLEEIADALNNDPDFAATMTTLLAGKVDKVSGKQLSTEDFSSALLSKLNGIAANATANSADATLLNRSNHTGAQAISTVTGLSTALDGKAEASDLTALAARVTALENWKAIMPKRMDIYTGTTDAAGKLTVSFPTGRYATAPRLIGNGVFNNDSYSLACNVLSSSTSGATVCFLREKNSAVLLGGNIVPSEPFATQSVVVIALEL